MKWLWITFVILISDTHSIQTRIQRPVRFIDPNAGPTRHFRHIDASTNLNFDWEHGLREATVQALYREHVGDHNIRKHIYSAPLLGKQDKATPFGDIAILARGQLYANYAGYIFVQDPYQNDCDDCHDIETEALRGRCIHSHCQIWHPRNNEQLIALWSIKRIRHRSSKDGYNRLEVEFSISPIGLRHPTHGYVTKEGTYNYNLPGHVFILKSPETHQNLDNEQNVNHFKYGAFIAQTPDGRKYILHSFPGILTPETPRYTPKDSLPTSSSTTTTQYSEEDPKKVYQTLLELLHKKTSVGPNRFGTSTPKSTILDTTLVQFPDGQVVPITELESPFITKTTPGYVTVRFPDTSRSPEQPTTPVRPVFQPSTTHVTTSQVQPQSYDISTPQQTTFVATQSTNRYTQQPPSEVYNTQPVYTKSTSVTNPPTQQYHSPTQEATSATTKPSVKMTFHYFAAEEEAKTTPKRPVATVPQPQYTENEIFLPATLRPTEPTRVFPSKGPKNEIKTTQWKGTSKYPIITKTPFTTISSTRPATVIKVTKPITEATSPSTQISKTYHTTEPTTKIIPSISFEPPTTNYRTTKIPHSDFTIPITVLEDTSVGTTTSQEKYATSRIENVLPVTTTREPTISTLNTKYTNTQLYNPTTIKLISGEHGTTPFEGISTAVSSDLEEPTKMSTLDTTYKEVSTLLPGHIETTLGVTKVMGGSQNKTMEMVYYAAEETEIPSEGTSPYIPTTRLTETTATSVKGTEPTNTVLKTEPPLSTPKRIVTTISANGTVSVKTTPFYAEEELFGLTKGSTKTTVSYKVSSTEPSDFLVYDGSQSDYKVPLYKKPLRDYSEDDIFGSTKSSYAKPFKPIEVTNEYTKSDIEQALFGSSNRKSKALIQTRNSRTTESTPPQVLYSRYYESSTLAMTTQPQIATLPSVEIVTPSVTTEMAPVSKMTPVLARKSFSVSRRPKFPLPKIDKLKKTHDQGDKTMPVTSQSYLTSISYEINKRKNPLSSHFKERHLESSTTENNSIEKVHKMTEKMDDTQETTIKYKTGANREIDNDFAIRLVGQAKGVAYLDRLSTTGASTTASISARTTKKAKYTRRRSYVARAKRPVRKKNVKDLDNR